jgi:hypothetical protein
VARIMSTGHFDRRAKQLSRLNKTVEETSTEPQTASSLSRAESEPSRVKQMTVGEGRKTTEPHGIEVRKPAAPRALSLAHVSTGGCVDAPPSSGLSVWLYSVCPQM